MWCDPNNERRAFKNYIHAYAYSLAIKARRAAEKNCDQQKAVSKFLERKLENFRFDQTAQKAGTAE